MTLHDELVAFGVTIKQCEDKLQEHGDNCANISMTIIELLVLFDDLNDANKIVAKIAIANQRKLLEKERREIRKWKSYIALLEGRKRTGTISESDIEAARSTDIVQVVSQKVELRKVNGSYFGKCPFHSEDTASFYIKNNFYHCFGCGESGDAIKFLMKTEGISFIEAVKRLA